MIAHSKSQSRNALRGTAFQKQVAEDILDRLQDEGIDQHFEIKSNEVFPVRLHPAAGKLRDYEIDIAIFCNGKAVVSIGAKKSFRERIEQDAIIAYSREYAAKRPNVPWYEVTEWEKTFKDKAKTKKWRQSDQVTFMEQKRATHTPLFRMVVCRALKDEYEDFIDDVVKQLQSSLLLSEHKWAGHAMELL